MPQYETYKESVVRNVHRQLPQSLLAQQQHKAASASLCDSHQFLSYRQAMKWVKENGYYLQRFMNILQLYPSLFQENAYDSLWYLIEPLLTTDIKQKPSSPIPVPDRDLISASPSPSSIVPLSSPLLPQETSDLSTQVDRPIINCIPNPSPNNLSSRTKESLSSPKKNTLISQAKTSNPPLSLRGKSIINIIPSIFISAESGLKNNEPGPKVYSSKVFLCKDPTDIEDAMTMAVLSSLSSVSFVHCLPPTIQPVKSIIPECDAFVFIMNQFTVSSSHCLSQLKHAQQLNLPIQFIRYSRFQLPQNLKEIVHNSLASATDLDQYLSIRRRSYVTSSASSVRDSCCSSDREASPERSYSPLLFREKDKVLLPHLPTSASNHLEKKSGRNSTINETVSIIVSSLKEGHKKAQLYDSKSHLACVSQMIDSVSTLLESPLSYNTAYFQLKKKRQNHNSATKQFLCSRPTTVRKDWLNPPLNRQTKNRTQLKKHNRPPLQTMPPAPAHCENGKHKDNLGRMITPVHRSESKITSPHPHHRRRWKSPTDNVEFPMSPASSLDSLSPTETVPALRISPESFGEVSDHDPADEQGQEEEEEKKKEKEEEERAELGKEEQEGERGEQEETESGPPGSSCGGPRDECLLAPGERETSYVVYPDCNSVFNNNKPSVIKWPVPWNHLEQVRRHDSETDSTSTNFFDVDLTKEIHTFSDED